MKEATFFPGNMTISATQNSEYAKKVGEMMGEELRALGINMNLAPSLDVNNNERHNSTIFNNFIMNFHI